MSNKPLKNLYARLRAEKLDALLVSKEINSSYLSGFEAEGSLILVSSRGNFIITDPRFAQESKNIPGFKARIARGSFAGALLQVLGELKIKRMGFESQWLSYRGYNRLKGKLKRVDLKPTTGLVEGLRTTKTQQEITSIKKAAGIIKAAFTYIKRVARPGMKEVDLAVKIDNFMRSAGAEGPAFPSIVACGANAAKPHAKCTNKRIGANSPILIDIGARYNGYNCDLTRMLHLGTITPKFQRVYEAVREAQKRAIAAVRPGIIISHIDRAARQYLTACKLGQFFSHSLGHGIGREVHESPRIAGDNKQKLIPGMVFTIEPGVYMSGWGGVRIEDMVLVTKKGSRVLTDDIDKRL